MVRKTVYTLVVIVLQMSEEKVVFHFIRTGNERYHIAMLRVVVSY